MELGLTEATEIAIPEIVCQDEDDVRAFWLCVACCAMARLPLMSSVSKKAVNCSPKRLFKPSAITASPSSILNGALKQNERHSV